MSFSAATTVFMVSILAVPTSYAFNKFVGSLPTAEPMVIAVAALSVQIFALGLIYFLTNSYLTTKEPLERVVFYGESICVRG